MSLAVPTRLGERPRCTSTIPHQQVSDNPDGALHARTRERFLAVEGVEIGPTLISVPGATALFVPECVACNPAALMRGREFAHIHPVTDGSFHLVLSDEDAAAVLEAGWGELHPLVLSGDLDQQVLLIYAPRDEAEIDVILAITEASKVFATGG